MNPPIPPHAMNIVTNSSSWALIAMNKFKTASRLVRHMNIEPLKYFYACGKVEGVEVWLVEL